MSLAARHRASTLAQSIMLCQQCQTREAMVHLTQTTQVDSIDESVPGKLHFCESCSDAYFANTPGMNSNRGLICLSDAYRSKLYDQLEVAHPEAFDQSDDKACDHSSQLMRDFLREHLDKDNVAVNEDAFEMLCQDFFCSHHFYTRLDEFHQKKR
jgi:hypothetical protein